MGAEQIDILMQTLVQVGVYAGFPAAVAGNKVGQAFFRDLEAASGTESK